jgi:hypothetical protein
MARLTNVILDVGRTAAGSGRFFADVSYDVEFSPAEVRLNVAFNDAAVLFDRDAEVDLVLLESMIAFGTVESTQRIVRGAPGERATAQDRDEIIGAIFPIPPEPLFVDARRFTPDGATTRHINHRREWQFPRGEEGPEEYRALVIVVPEIRYAMGWSNERVINLV